MDNNITFRILATSQRPNFQNYFIRYLTELWDKDAANSRARKILTQNFKKEIAISYVSFYLLCGLILWLYEHLSSYLHEPDNQYHLHGED